MEKKKTYWVNPQTMSRIPDLKLIADENNGYVQAVIDGLKWNVIGANRALQTGGY